jgi:cytoskeletal protein RodZ
MAETLGEKLRQAREERGVTITEVAEQTRISPHYIELIEQTITARFPAEFSTKALSNPTPNTSALTSPKRCRITPG